MRASSCSRPRGPMWTRSSAFRPTVAIEQRTSRGGRKSTVATLTEIYHFLRLLYVKLGTQYCPDCDVAIEPQSAGLDRRAPAARLSRASASRCSRRWSWPARASTPISRSGPRRRATGRCASMASQLPTAPWPRLSRFKEHTIELPVAELDVGAQDRVRTARRRWPRRWTSARAWCTCWRRKPRA